MEKGAFGACSSRTLQIAKTNFYQKQNDPCLVEKDSFSRKLLEIEAVRIPLVCGDPLSLLQFEGECH